MPAAVDFAKFDQLVDLFAPVDSPESPNEVGEEPAKGRCIEEGIWAAVDGLSGDEALHAASIQADATHRVEMYYREGITTRNWLYWKGRRLDIAHVRDPVGQGWTLELLCRENATEPA